MTIRRDIEILTLSYPIVIDRGRHGCVRVVDGYYLHYKSSDRKTLSQKQIALLRKLRAQLTGDDLDTINSILVQFAP